MSKADEPARVRPAAAVSTQFAQRASKDTGPEVALRKALHAHGLRYRVHWPVPGMPRRSIDIAFPGLRVAVFVDGCFWHGCSEHRRPPATNSEWWQWKIDRNRARDESTNQLLAEHGWEVLRFWEHDGLDDAYGQVVALVASRRPT